jgi:hypothetical protein
MAEKIGSEFTRDMIDRGRRELGGVLFPESNVAQPMYPLRGGYGVSQEKEAEREESVLGEHLDRANQSRDDPGRDDRDQGIDRE